MRFTQSLAGLSLAALTTVVPMTPAHAATNPTASGALCSLNTSPSEPGTQTGTVSGGPVVSYDTLNPAFIPNPYIVCSIQVGGSGTFDDPDVAQIITWHPGYATYLPPRAVSFTVPIGQTVYLCSEIWIATGDGHLSIYYSDPQGVFSTNPSTAQCQVAAIASTPQGPAFNAPSRVVLDASTTD